MEWTKEKPTKPGFYWGVEVDLSREDFEAYPYLLFRVGCFRPETKKLMVTYAETSGINDTENLLHELDYITWWYGPVSIRKPPPSPYHPPPIDTV